MPLKRELQRCRGYYYQLVFANDALGVTHLVSRIQESTCRRECMKVRILYSMYFPILTMDFTWNNGAMLRFGGLFKRLFVLGHAFIFPFTKVADVDSEALSSWSK